MRALQTLIFLIITTNAGGQAKSLIARLCKSLFLMTGQEVVLLDSDYGNATSQHLDPSALGIRWGASRSLAPDMFAAYSGRHVIIDCGANQWASAREINDLIPELAKLFAAAGYRNIAFLPFTPNKPGAAASLQELEPSLPPMEKIYVRSDSDGSKEFEAIDASKPVVNLGHLMPGFVGYLKSEAPASFFDVVKNPPPGRKLAGRYVGRWMHDFAMETSKFGLFANAVPQLAQVPIERELRLSAPTERHCSDEALRQNQHKSAILHDIDKYGWTPEGLRKAATALEQRSV